jgi:inward rectifier potassium channel
MRASGQADGNGAVEAVGRAERLDVVRRGTPSNPAADLYHALLASSWGALGLAAGCGYLAVNALFATFYALQPGAVTNATSWVDCFFFSVQTMATIGYGVMAPATPWAHALVTIEALVGMLGVAMTSGLFFAKFATPQANLVFSNVAVVGLRDGVPTLQFRMANARNNRIVEASVRVSMLADHVTAEGERIRAFEDLVLVRDNTPMFALSWLVQHRLEGSSPFARLTREELERRDAELIVTVTGVDETFRQSIHGRWGYRMSDLRWDHRFVDALTREGGTRVLDLGRFDEVVPI